MYHYAQTYPQLFNQLRDLDYSSADLTLIQGTYELAMMLFTSRFQPSGKVFMAHVVGTASILASLRLPPSVVAAALIHNAYMAGDFGDGRHGLAIKRREQMKRRFGPEIEQYVARFATVNWIKLGQQNPDKLDAIDRNVLLILMADHLEHLHDLDLLYYEDRVRQHYLDNCKLAIKMAQSMNLSSLAAELAEGIRTTETARIPVDLPVERITGAAFVIPPKLRRKRLTVRFYNAATYHRRRLRRQMPRQLNRCRESARKITRSVRARLRQIIQPIRRQSRRVGRMKGISKAFEGLFCEDARLERIVGGFQFTEGPIWTFEERSLLFSDIPANRILRLKADTTVEIYRQPSGNSNGLTRDKEGRVIVCEQGNRRVTRTEKDGSTKVLAEAFLGKKLNSPNDVIVKSDGTIYFTDPNYGIRPEEQEQEVQGVYQLSPEGLDISLVASDFARPNGLAFSPDEKKLYIDDSERRHIRVFDVQDDGSLSGGAVFHDMNIATPGAPDGMKVDLEGRVYCTGAGGVWVFDPDGNHLGTIVTPEKPSNCAWGGMDSRTLYITACTSVYAIRVRTPGLGPRKMP
jgi:gluconolactonase